MVQRALIICTESKLDSKVGFITVTLVSLKTLFNLLSGIRVLTFIKKKSRQNIYIYIYIYIYIEREREREREMYTYIYIHIHISFRKTKKTVTLGL